MKTYKKLLTILMLIISMICTGVPVIAGSTDYHGHWAEKQIAEFIEKGYVSLYSDGTFKPGTEITRAEFVDVINKFFGLTGNAALKVDNGQSSKVNRSEAVSTIATVSNLKVSSDISALKRFKDFSSIPDTERKAINAAVKSGLVLGYPDSSFAPTKPIKRAEVVAILYRAQSIDATLQTSITEDSTSQVEQTFKGWLEDVHCAGKISDPAKGTKMCLLMKGCAASGYGIIIKQDDGTYRFIKFDETGTKLAKSNVIDKTKKDNNLTIIVTGVLDGDTLKVSTIEEEL